MRGAPCPSCGSTVGWGVARCPHCGSALDIVVEPVTEPAARVDEVELGRRMPRWWSAAAVGGAVGVLLIGAVASGGASPRASQETTSSLPGTSTTVGPSTTKAPSTTHAPTPSTTVPDRLTLPGAPLVPPSAGRAAVLYGLDLARQHVWRVDLDSGQTTVRDVEKLLGSSPDLVQLIPRQGGVVLTSGSWSSASRQALFLPDDATLPTQALSSGADWPLTHADPGLVWVVTPGDGPSARAAARVVDMTGEVVAGPVLLPPGDVLGDDGQGRLLVRLAAATYTASLDGAVALEGSGSMLGWSAERTVGVECAATEVRCDVVARDRGTGAELGRSPIPTDRMSSFADQAAPGRLAPGGDALATVDRADASRVHVTVTRFDGEPPLSVNLAVSSSTASPVGPGPPAISWLDDDVVCALSRGQVGCAALHGAPDGQPVVRTINAARMPRFAAAALSSPEAVTAAGSFRPPPLGPATPATLDEYLALANAVCNAGQARLGNAGTPTGDDLRARAMAATALADQGEATLLTLRSIPQPETEQAHLERVLSLFADRIAALRTLASAAESGNQTAANDATRLASDLRRQRVHVEPRLRDCFVP